MNIIRRERFLYRDDLIRECALRYRYNLYQIKHIYIVGIIDLVYIGWYDYSILFYKFLVSNRYKILGALVVESFYWWGI